MELIAISVLILLRKHLTELDLQGNMLQSILNLHRLRTLKSLDLCKSPLISAKGSANSCRFE